MRNKTKGMLLIFALSMVLLIAVSAPAMADEAYPVAPMSITGNVQAEDGSAVTEGEILVLAGAKEVGTGSINPAGYFAALVTSDFGQELSFVVVISGEEYTAESTPAKIESKEGDMLMDVVLEIELETTSGGNSGNSSGNSSGGSSETAAPAAPAATPAAGVVASGTQVVLATSTSGASIYYTTDGTSPKDSNSRITYNKPIEISADTTIKAVSYKNDKYSNEVTYVYQINDEAPQEKEFTDLTGHWAVDTVKQLVSKGIISGYEDNSFRPDNLITRAECSVIMSRAFSLADGSQDTLSAFSDASVVPSWASGKVAAAVEAGLLNGYPEADGTKTFMPDKQVTRVELATILSRVVVQKLGVQTPAAPTFTDLAVIPAWGLEGASIAADKGLVKGYPDGTFMPEKPVTRAEAAAMIDRLLSAL